jgi:Cu-Zn family superoxide dismutase
MTHGGPSDDVRHAGDLGNIIADGNGAAVGTLFDSVAKMYGPSSVLHRAIVVHAGADDLGQGGFDDSSTTGHAGGRLACGAIRATSAECMDIQCPGSPPAHEQTFSREPHAGATLVASFADACEVVEAEVLGGAHDMASPNFMGLASLGLEIGIFCDFLCSVLLLNAILGLDFSGLALSRPQVLRRIGSNWVGQSHLPFTTFCYQTPTFNNLYWRL